MREGERVRLMRENSLIDKKNKADGNYFPSALFFIEIGIHLRS